MDRKSLNLKQADEKKETTKRNKTFQISLSLIHALEYEKYQTGKTQTDIVEEALTQYFGNNLYDYKKIKKNL